MKLSMVRAFWPARAPADWKQPIQIQKWCLYKGRGVVSEPICANKVRNGPASADQGCTIASQGSYHVHGTLCWNPLTSWLPLTSNDVELQGSENNSLCSHNSHCFNSVPFKVKMQKIHANMATLDTPTCTTCSERFPGSLSPKAQWMSAL